MARSSSTQNARQSWLRLGAAAEMLGLSVDTLRRWVDADRIPSRRSASGQREVAVRDVSRLAAQRRSDAAPASRTGPRHSIATSARNRFPGVVTRIEKDRVAAVVEVQAGPHRLISLMTAEAVDELGLRVGDAATCVVKATNVIVELPGA
jgi:molybdopterin-binding protein